MKLKLVHILNRLDGDREIKSINSLSKIKGIEYIQQVTPLYDGEYPIPITDYYHNKGHYGNYLSFTKAITENFSSDIDALILCECDCVLNIPVDNFLPEMKKTLDYCQKHGIYEFSWGGKNSFGYEQSKVYYLDEEYPNYCIVDKIILAHFIILPASTKWYWINKIYTTGWDGIDIWFNEAIHEFVTGKQATVIKSLADQCTGQSLIDEFVKGEEVPYLSEENITYNFDNGGAFVEIIGENSQKLYRVEFINHETQDIVYSTVIKANNWTMSKKFVTYIKVYDENLHYLIMEKTIYSKD